jgi:pSer/pThr/pTyr-binding forkhead associated (FHA) protein
VVTHGRAQLEDLRSKNGTVLRGTPVNAVTELCDGDEFLAGGEVLRFSAPRPDASTETDMRQPVETKSAAASASARARL